MADEKLEKLQQKYVSVLRVLNQEDFKVKNMHVQDDKLFIRAEAPSQEAKSKLWNEVKKVDPEFKDFTADISVSAPQTGPKKTPEVAAAVGRSEQAQPNLAAASGDTRRTYTVQKGDTLSKISKQFYGNPNEYRKIFDANREQLKDPDKIYPGQVLTIPD